MSEVMETYLSSEWWLLVWWTVDCTGMQQAGRHGIVELSEILLSGKIEDL